MNTRHLLLPAVLVLFAGCGADFDPYNRLTKPRVLAIRSEPPSPPPGGTTTLTPILYTPDGDPPVSFAWSWCPAPGPSTAGYPCLVTEADLAANGAGNVPAFDLGSAPTATFTHSVPTQLLQTLCQATPGSVDPPDCEGGFPVQVKMTMSTATWTIVTVSTLRLPFDPATPVNHNPHLGGLAAVLDGVEQPIGDDPTVIVPRKVETVVRAQVPAEDSEAYEGKNDEGVVGPLHERLTLTWFVETGDLHDGRTGYIENVTKLEDALKNKWEPARETDYPGETARIIVVVRDNRGGVASRAGVVRLGAAP